MPASGAVYVAFGKALGVMRGNTMDVHGAGSQRSDPKTGKPMSRGPQGDYIRVDNYVRSVRAGNIELATEASHQYQAEQVYQYSNSSSAIVDTTNTSMSTSSDNKTHKMTHNKNSSPHNKFINRFDKNGDGKVSASEFQAGTKRFNHFDENKDGYITANEAPTGPPKNTK